MFPGQVYTRQVAQCLGRNAAHRPRRISRQALHEVRGKSGNVLPPLAQRRHVDVDHVEAVIEVASESSGRDFRRQIAIGGRHETYVDVDRACASEPLEFAQLHRPERLLWSPGASSPISSRNTVPAVGNLELAFLLGHGAGEGAAFMAEQLAFEQRFGERGAVHGNKRPLRPRRCSDGRRARRALCPCRSHR